MSTYGTLCLKPQWWECSVCVFAYPRGCEQITDVIAKQPGGRQEHSFLSNMLHINPTKVLSVWSKVHAVIKEDETQKDAALLKLFLFACVWVGVRKKPEKEQKQTSAASFISPNVCGNQSHTTPGPCTFLFAHTSLKSYYFPHTFSLQVALSSGLQLEAGILNLRWQMSTHACKQSGHQTLKLSNKCYWLCLKVHSYS